MNALTHERTNRLSDIVTLEQLIAAKKKAPERLNLWLKSTG